LLTAPDMNDGLCFAQYEVDIYSTGRTAAVPTSWKVEPARYLERPSKLVKVSGGTDSQDATLFPFSPISRSPSQSSNHSWRRPLENPSHNPISCLPINHYTRVFYPDLQSNSSQFVLIVRGFLYIATLSSVGYKFCSSLCARSCESRLNVLGLDQVDVPSAGSGKEGRLTLLAEEKVENGHKKKTLGGRTESL